MNSKGSEFIEISHMVSMYNNHWWWVGFDAGGEKSNVSVRLFAFFEGWHVFFLFSL